jgi:two-component system nitrogen regulation sensor histidine kinase NtrY
LNLPKIHRHLPRRSLILFAAGLFLLSFVSAYYFQVQPSVNYQQKSLQRYINNQEADARDLLRDTPLMRKLVLNTESLKEFKSVGDKPYGVFLFAETLSEQQDLLFWNNQKIVPPSADFNLPDGEYFKDLVNGSFVVIKSRLIFPDMSNNIIAHVMIPVKSQYYLETDYLMDEFVHDEDASKKVEISLKATEYPIQSESGKTLFYLQRKSHTNLAVTDTLTIVLRMAALIFLLVFIHLTGEAIVHKSRGLYGVIFFSGAMFLVRYLLFKFGNLFSFRQFPLFDPTIYGANNLNPSLGDLLINSIMVCWIVLFTWYNLGPRQRIPSFLSGKRIYAAGFVALFVLVFATFQLANVVRSLVADSKISFNVTDFFGLDVYTVIGLIVLALLSLSYYYFTRLLFRFIFTAFKDHYYYVYFSLLLVGLLYLTLRSGNPIVLFHLPVLIWLLVYTLLVSQEKFLINRFRVTVAGVLFWIFVFSVSLSAIILQANRQNEMKLRKSIAEKQHARTDPTNDRTVNIAISYLNNRFLLHNFWRFANPDESRRIRDSIITRAFISYARRYDTKIYVFDAANQPINNEDSMGFPELNTLFTVQSKPTQLPGLNYLESSGSFTYITRRLVTDSTRELGSFFILSTPRQYVATQKLYPELFRQVSRVKDPENSNLYFHAVYLDKKLQSASSKYPFPIEITESQVPQSEFDPLRVNGDYDELWYKPSSRKVVVVAKKKDSLIESITLFSYIFCAFLFMVGFIQLVSYILKGLQDWRSFRFLAQFSIRSQIHGTVIFISVLSFLIIGVATISFFIARYDRNNIDKLSVTSDIMVREFQKRLKDTSDFNPNLSDPASIYNMRRLIKDVADIHAADVNVYDLEGNLQVSSDEEVYRQGVLSKKMHPEAFYHLQRMRQVQYVQKEELSSLKYWSIYSAVRNDSFQAVKYLNIPYFSSQLDLQQEISNFLVTIINLNAFILLIAGIIALFITNKITQSFSLIGEKMKEITLGRTNEEIVWNRDDEIGELVNEYNKMVHQLEESAEALAKSEREGAWREMARQVAHEIKNPLTPMKLSIQYLQKVVDSNQGNVKELTANVANTLIEQIDHLSKIAADFSQFANIGNKKIELVDLHQVIGILVDLYSSNPKVRINWRKIPGSLVMKADKTHMNRVFTNLLANAVDACAHKDSCRIIIDEEQQEQMVTIRIRDNGEGIPEEMHNKIFTPNFTTKTSGTGLGLAMCKSIVEQAGGQIWFETEVGKGTTFFVTLPVIG